MCNTSRRTASVVLAATLFLGLLSTTAQAAPAARTGVTASQTGCWTLPRFSLELRRIIRLSNSGVPKQRIIRMRTEAYRKACLVR